VAVKVVRQPNKIALLGSPTSAAALAAGREGAPGALRAAGLVERLRAAGYDVTDLGDDPVQVSKPDEESPRARNLPAVLAALEALRPRVEAAVKSGALPLILSGDSSAALATIAGVRRYFRRVSLIYMDGDADLHTPATTSSGCVDGMVVAHLIGRGAAEMVRFWSEPPLVREPDAALFGVTRIDPAEEELLRESPMRRYFADDVRSMGAAAAAQAAVERIHGSGHEFVLHLGVDVITDFQATDDPVSAGLRVEEVGEALEVFVRQNHLAAIEVAEYNPARDTDGSGARIIVNLLAEALSKRLEAVGMVPTIGEAVAVTAAAEPSAAPVTPPTAPEQLEQEPPLPNAAPGEAWSSETAEPSSEAPEPAPESPAAAASEVPEKASETPS